jgi:hypothetical protein
MTTALWLYLVGNVAAVLVILFAVSRINVDMQEEDDYDFKTVDQKIYEALRLDRVFGGGER